MEEVMFGINGMRGNAPQPRYLCAPRTSAPVRTAWFGMSRAIAMELLLREVEAVWNQSDSKSDHHVITSSTTKNAVSLQGRAWLILCLGSGRISAQSPCLRACVRVCARARECV